jgi:hypothetical protein
LFGTEEVAMPQMEGLSPFLLLPENDEVSGEILSLTAKASISVLPLIFVRKGNAMRCR